MHFEPEMFEDIKLIDDELTKINETWCEVVHATKIHATKKLSECHSDIRQARRIGNILIWLKEWNYSDKRDSRYLIYTYNLK